MNDIIARSLLVGKTCEECAFLSINNDDTLRCLLKSYNGSSFTKSGKLPKSLTCGNWMKRIDMVDFAVKRLLEIKNGRQSS